MLINFYTRFLFHQDPEPKGFIDVAGHCVRRLRPNEAEAETDKRNVLKIICPERTYYLFAEKQEEIDEWTIVLRKVRKLFQRGFTASLIVFFLKKNSK